MKPDKIPDSFVFQRNTSLDTTSHYHVVRDIPCWDCGTRMPGDMGIQVARKLAGSDVKLHVVVHPGCHLKA